MRFQGGFPFPTLFQPNLDNASFHLGFGILVVCAATGAPAHNLRLKKILLLHGTVIGNPDQRATRISTELEFEWWRIMYSIL